MSGYGPIGMIRDVAEGVYSWIVGLCCAVSCATTSFEVNGRSLRVIRQLAEGGFSFVYLVEQDGQKFALK